MKWTIIQLQKFRNKGVSLDESIQMDELTKMDPSIRAVSPIRVEGRVEIGSNRVTFHLHITGHFTLACSRTLLDVRYPIDIHSIETVLYHRGNEHADEEDTHYAEGDTIDLRPIIRELLLLEVPLQVYSENENDEAAAPQSGTGWKVIHEKPKKDTVDPRLAKLAKFFDQNDTPSS